jgi:uncharacterized damage-inducible protein DinB
MRNDPWLGLIERMFLKQRAAIEKAVAQLSDDELRRRPAPGFNSVATIIRHVAGNLSSRFTDFLTTDGEKPTRDREGEFADWAGSRAELMARFDAGFRTLLATVESLTDTDLDRSITIRGQPLNVRDALLRAVDHIGGHVGQIVYLARLMHEGEWQWLSIAPGKSAEFKPG